MALSEFLRIHPQDGYTALMYAAEHGRADCVRLLIDTGADKEAKDYVSVDRCFAGAPFRFVSFSLLLFHFHHFSFSICLYFL
jgi:ankyrin repeat protein